MLSIQEAGTEILTGAPRSLYFLCGQEYGVKKEYIEKLEKHYGQSKKEVPSIADFIKFMESKHLVPLVPTVYVIRYDDTFLSSLSDATAHRLRTLFVVGTVICLYQSEKATTKLDKYFPNNVVNIPKIGQQFIFKYLRIAFPKLPDRFLSLVVTIGSDYNQCKLMCEELSLMPLEKLLQYSDEQLQRFLGKSISYSENSLKLAIACRNVSHLANYLEDVDVDESFYYTLLSTLLELEKIKVNNYAQSDLKDFSNRWTRQDIYNLFNIVYRELKNSRSSTFSNLKISYLYCINCLGFSPVPPLEVLVDA